LSDLRPQQRDGVEIDVCPQCRGIWLDAGELERVGVAEQSYYREERGRRRRRRDDDDDDDFFDDDDDGRRGRGGFFQNLFGGLDFD
jgi:Zn-finger nucleic acid-binding protein